MKTKKALNHVPDSRLIAACLDGDGDAWEALLQRYQRLIYSVPIRYRFSQQDAADIFQNVCLRLLDNLADLRDRSKLSCWLITVTRRECARCKTNAFREVPLRKADRDDPLPDIPATEPAPDDLTIQWQQQHLLQQAIERLPERHRRLIRYLFYELLSYEEIAERLQMPVASIGPTRGRALEKLKRIMESLVSDNSLKQLMYSAGVAGAHS